MTDVYIIGSKGIPAAYGGYETFVEQLVAGQKSREIRYHVACAQALGGKKGIFTYHGAECFRIPYRTRCASKAVFYDLDALWWVLADVEKRRAEGIVRPFVIYVLACRIGPFFGTYARRAHALGGTVWINPDGHEWLRGKWSIPVRLYWKLSEALMVKHADLVICDSKKILSYIRAEYPAAKGKSRYLSYGAKLLEPETIEQRARFDVWCAEHGVHPGRYYLIVGRFVPENNYEVMIREFMASHTAKSLVLITDYKGSAYYRRLCAKTKCLSDPRIVFAGTAYDKKLLASIRMHAYAYLHGHSVGGTNPSLLEALAETETNLLYNIDFHREVAGKAAFYWKKRPGNLAALIDRVDAMSPERRKRMGEAAKQRIREHYTWDRIIGAYEKLCQR